MALKALWSWAASVLPPELALPLVTTRTTATTLVSDHLILAVWPRSGGSSLPKRPNAVKVDANAEMSSDNSLTLMSQHQEMRRLREDVARLQVQCSALQEQVERLDSERRRRGGGGGGGGGFKWSTLWFGGGGTSADVARIEESENGTERRTTGSGMKGRAGLATPTPTRQIPMWRKSTP